MTPRGGRGWPRRPAARPWRSAVGLAIIAFGVLAHPMLSALGARSMRGAEVALPLPDETATVTIGALVILGSRWCTRLVPLARLALSALQHWAMGAA